MRTSKVLAQSANKNEVSVFTLGDPLLPKFVLIGGVHGDEPEGSVVVEDFISHAEKIAKQFNSCVLVIPRLNPDGLKINERVNGNGVDLNRNFPADDWSSEHRGPRYYPGPKPASEPEIKGLVKLLTDSKPFLIVHCHTYSVPQVCYTGAKSTPWATLLGTNFGYPVTKDIGYPTPGSLGQYSLLNLDTACVCLEFPEGIEPPNAWKMAGPSLLEIATLGP
jgi:protein MpaA